MSKFQGVLKMFMLGMLKTILKTVLKYDKNTITLYRHVKNHIENRVEVRKKHHHTLWCVLKLSSRGPKIRRQTTRFESEFTRVTEVIHIYSNSTCKIRTDRNKLYFE